MMNIMPFKIKTSSKSTKGFEKLENIMHPQGDQPPTSMMIGKALLSGFCALSALV